MVGSEASPNTIESIHSTCRFRSFATRLKQGDDDAAVELVKRYARRLHSLAAQRMSRMLRVKVDPEDVLQSVLISFFVQMRDGKFDFESSQALRGLLAMMVVRKCSRYASHYKTLRRDLSKEVWHQPSLPGAQRIDNSLSREPSPNETTDAMDAFEHWLRDLDEQSRQILCALLEGKTTATIAMELGCSQRTVQRTILRAQHKLSVPDQP